MKDNIMKKIERDGKVAVLYSPGYGAGWSTWAYGEVSPDVLCMDARIVQHVLDNDNEGAARAAKEMFPNLYTGGAKDLCVAWVPKGQAFEILEYDGSESIRFLDSSNYMVA